MHFGLQTHKSMKRGGIMKRKALRLCLSVVLYVVVFAGMSPAAVLAGVPIEVFDNILFYDDHIYAITKNTMSWTDAKNLAAQYGGHLVTVNDKDENDFLKDNYGPVYGNPWIGLNDLQSPGTWVWTYGWAGYTNWSEGKPSGGAEHCVVTNWTEARQWNDEVCTGSRLAIIEWETLPAAVNLPRTGQIVCYNEAGEPVSCEGTGQDGDFRAGVSWPDPRYTVADDCVIDNLTGLVWSKDGKLFSGTRSWQETLDAVQGLNNTGGLCEHADWRLPNANELQSLVYPYPGNTLHTWLNSRGFERMQQDCYWSSTTGAYNPDYALKVSMSGGAASYFSKGVSCYAIPVRGTATGPARVPKTGQTVSYDVDDSKADDGGLQSGVPWPDPRFLVIDECIMDTLTGLIWTRNGNLAGGQKTWQEALDFADTQNEIPSRCGRTDWRLPNLFEMMSLINYGQLSTAAWLNNAAQGFSSVQSSYYWTSSNYEANAWTVYMGSGFSSHNGKTSTSYVWPVSGGNCYLNVARRVDSVTTDHFSIQAAYDAGSLTHEIRALFSDYCEDIYFDEGKTVSLAGGHDYGFSLQPGYSHIYGSLTVHSGIVTVENIIIL
jgi:hypothetical protein